MNISPAVYNTSVSQHVWIEFVSFEIFQRGQPRHWIITCMIVWEWLGFSQHKQYVLSTLAVCMNNYAIEGMLVLEYRWQHMASPFGLKSQNLMNSLEFVTNTVEINYDKLQRNLKVKRFLLKKTQLSDNLNWIPNAQFVWHLDSLGPCLKLKVYI